MNLAARSSRGYAMAALLVGISIMAILLSVALPTWSHLIRREKEEELIFRGTQYARAINRYQRTGRAGGPPTIDVLIEQKFLRKKYKDPLSPEKDGEFQLLRASNLAPQGGRGSAGGSGTTTGTGAGTGSAGGAGYVGFAPSPFQTTTGPIVGVASKNTGESIRVYNGKQRYNEWQFLGTEMSAQAGGGAGGGRAGQRGGPEGDRGGRGAGGIGGRGRGGGSGTTFTPFGPNSQPPPSRQGR